MIYEKLFDWQKKLVDTIKNKSAYGLFLDMGLGKTPISLALCEQNSIEKVLIITINSKAMEGTEQSGSWLNWASKSNIRYKLLDKSSNSLETNLTSDFTAFVVNYEYLFKRVNKKNESFGLRDTIEEFIESCKGKRSAIIVDESHKMKDGKSLQTKAINRIYKKLCMISSKTYIYLLTGTPFTKGYIDLYNQLKILGLPMNKEAFKDHFCVMGQFKGRAGWQQPIIRYKNIDELFSLVHQYAITIQSSDVIKLPEQVFSYHQYKMTNAFKLYLYEKLSGKEIYDEMKRRRLPCKIVNESFGKKFQNPFYRNIDYPEFNWSAETSGEFWLRARELSIGFQGNANTFVFYDRTRLSMLEKFLQENEDNYLLFYSYTPELIEIYEICEKLGYNIDVYSGELKSLLNYNRFESLPESEKLTSKKNILIANWSSGSTGMNFQAYNKCIVFDLPVYKDWQQGIKRIHRTGQKNTCIYHIFIQDCFLDKGMMNAIKLQQDYTKDTFESDLKRVHEIIGRD